MNTYQLEPRKALNAAFLKIKPNRTQIEVFKSNLKTLLDHCNEKETEEFHKNLVSDFLKKTYYDDKYFVNTKGRNDLVIHNSATAKSSVGVVIEAKSPSNKSEMIDRNNLNGKALQELVLYFLRERITENNLEIKHLVVTNIYEWFVFDAQVFDKLFAQNKSFVKQFQEFEAKQLSNVKTDFFYKEIAKPFLEKIQSEIQFTYFDFRNYNKALRNNNNDDDKSLIALFKLLSPEHLLKLSFANDSNTLDKNFYNELLHVIGLNEVKDGGKKVIGRHKLENRSEGSLIENTILQLDTLDKIARLENPKQYGETRDEQLFSVALELTITWVNRILFLKLLEAQLITYHKKDKSYSFLNADLIPDYDILNKLFFQVLAKNVADRTDKVAKDFAKVPYLNSSLFEPTDLEHQTLLISNLENNLSLPLLNATVIKNSQGKKTTGTKNALDYFFAFLDSYDFASEGSEDIQEDNKTLINASVLGLIFEKINGYKDGSFFTPSFITMYMCRETIRRAVVQKFNEVKQWTCETFDDLKNKDFSIVEANKIINSLKICDPAVGSGHFLVSALNEIIAIKHELQILADSKHNRLKNYNFEVVNDELIVTDQDGIPFVYYPKNAESQRIQETLFHEKQTIIESCLFGVDINPNSVKICRLRLWIELLKNAYYLAMTDVLETLPNIDINIKCGNSLISRFALDADLKKALKQNKWNIESYKLAVTTYQNAETKEQKREMERLIDEIKGNFETEIAINDKRKIKLEAKKGELFNYTQQIGLFEYSKKEQTAWNKKVNTLTVEVKQLETELEDIKSNKIYQNAFEWRFEFPQVLDDDGAFIGFDVVIGNPPYLLVFDDIIKNYIEQNYIEFKRNNDLYVAFIIKGHNLLKENGNFSFITPNTFLKGTYFENLRYFFKNKFQINEIIDFGIKLIFDDANVFCSIINSKKSIPKQNWVLKSDIGVKKGEIEYDSTEFLIIPDLIKKLHKLDKIENHFFVKDVGFNYWTEGRGKVRGESIGSRVLYKGLKNNDLDLPYIKGSDISKYSLSFSNNYLKNNWKEILNKDDTFRYSKDLLEKNEKLIYRQTSNKIIATLDNNQNLCDKTVHIILNDKNNYSLKYLLGLLNSKLYNFYFTSFKEEEGRAFAQVKTVDIKNLPFIYIKNFEINIESKVNEILAIKKENPQADTIILENEIDVMVYELYGLSEEEIAIVENS